MTTGIRVRLWLAAACLTLAWAVTMTYATTELADRWAHQDEVYQPGDDTSHVGQPVGR